MLFLGFQCAAIFLFFFFGEGFYLYLNIVLFGEMSIEAGDPIKDLLSFIVLVLFGDLVFNYFVD